MKEFRARDTDRDRAVGVIEAAYVDGQIGDADRDLRVARARSAEMLDELEGLTRDLRLPQVVGAPVAPARTASRTRPSGVLVGLGLFVVLVGAGVTGVVALAMFAVSGTSDMVTSPGVEAAPAPIEEVVERASFRMTAPQVRRFVAAYEKKFGTHDSFGTVFYPTRVSIEVPVRGSRPRAERWSYDGTWRQDSLPSAVVRPGGIVDLGRIDARRLFANIGVAERTLDVEDGELTHVGLRTDMDGAPTLNIHIGNTFNESGYLMTSPSGDVIRRFPFES